MPGLPGSEKRYNPGLSGVRGSMDHAWQDWIQRSLDMGCSRDELRAILEQSNFSAEDIATHLDQRTAKPGLQSIYGLDHEALTRVNITQVATRVETDMAQLYTLDNFLSAEECEVFLALSSERLYDSKVGTGYTTNRRSSRSSDLHTHRHPLIPVVDARIAKTLGINTAYSELMQIQRYEVGQEFQYHHDYFTPGTEPFEKHAMHSGNRTWTFMIYLNDVASGGGTEFTKLGMRFQPKAGQALIWNNLDKSGAPNPNTEHAGLPVEDGYKVIITKWFRERCTLPMFI